MRFDVTTALDAIEHHLTTEVALAQAVVDLGETAWFDALDAGRPVSLLRVGQLIDALSRHLGEESVMVYGVAGRQLLTDADLTSKERMVLGRWAGDGLIEVVATVGDRVPEVADLTGLPVVTALGFPHLAGRYPWLVEQSERVLRLTPSDGGARLVGAGATTVQPSAAGAALLRRVWRCTRRDCPAFGDRRGSTQAVPRVSAGVPVCPRHDEPLTDAGPKLSSLTLALVVDGVVRTRFVLRGGRSVTVGRSPDGPDGIMIGAHLSGQAAQMISRSHVRLELRDDILLVSDISTNGTVVRSRTSPFAAADEVRLAGGAPYPLRQWDTVELYHGVLLSRADNSLIRTLAGQSETGSVLGDAPTVTMWAAS